MKKADRSLYITATLLCASILVALFAAFYLVLSEPPEDTPEEEKEPRIAYEAYVLDASLRYDVSASRIYAVIQTESSFRPEVVSKSGAVGLMQMLPSTYEEQCAKRGEKYNPDDLKNPAVNIDYCTEYLRYLYDLTGNWDCAHVAYHAGIGNVRRWLKNPAYSDDGKTLKVIPVEQSRIYLERINAAYGAYERVLAAENDQ